MTFFFSNTLQLAVLSSKVKSKGSPYLITEHRVPELIPVLGSLPAGDMSHKPGCRLPLLSARPTVTLASLKRAATSFAVLVNRGTMDVNILPKTDTCYLTASRLRFEPQALLHLSAAR